MNFPLKASVLLIMPLILLGACGGGGGGGVSTSSAAAKTVSQGSITGFGSIIVDGVRYSSIGATITDDGDTTLRSDDLRIGMTVNVEGNSTDDLSTGEARTIEVRRLLQGPVTALTTGVNPTFTVLGQTVETTANTVIAGILANAANVKVYGLLQQGTPDKIIASRLEVVPQTRYEAYGRVSNLVGSTFNIGILAVTAGAGVALPNGFANGNLVKVSCATLPGCSDGASTLTADKIKLRGARNDLASHNGSLVKLKGVVDSVSGNGNLLTVAGITVDITNAAREDKNANTNTSYTPVVGDRLEIKGSYNGTTLVARKIEQEGYRESKHEGSNNPYSTELYGVVEASSNGCVGGQYLVQSVCINDAVSSPAPSLGQYVEIKGNMRGDVLDAVKVESKSGTTPKNGYIELEGALSNLDTNAKTFLLKGLTVNYANATLKGTLANGSFVEVKGTKDTQGGFKATKVDVESN